MPGGPVSCLRPRDLRRGAVLTLVFLGVLGAGAAGGCWQEEDPFAREYVAGAAAAPGGEAAGLPGAAGGADAPDPAQAARTADRAAVARAAAQAAADGKSGRDAAEEVVGRSGDRWGVVYGRTEYEEFAQSLDGSYTGVGLRVAQASGAAIAVAQVRSGGPADRAGIRAGDRLRTVDGRAVGGLPPAEVIALLRGADRGAGPGSRVVLELERAGRARTETLLRERLSTAPVTVRRLPGGITLIKVTAFTRGSGAQVRAAVRSAPAGGGVMLDLRGNPGGLIGEAVTAASAFLDGGLVATYDVRGAERALYAQRGGDTVRPLVALVDGGTMSAAELVTGALQDRGRAVTVGTRTFGKGSVQMPTELPDGSVAELTVGLYRTPAGRSPDGRGIAPDLAVADRAEERARSVLSGLGAGS
ncbi:PDZ domain-containing protein [Streptomyces bambusae]|uniref:S41 family peptidase n=1 Tax=Streptomyces bambusae TaxID=1550616 RepID=UPI001CFECC32|nr:S41 family peptidase [Streptomyces bambusae]MCB5167302.1 PDZ domain-containing protein [Streptomyces bambusae]